MVSRMFRFSHPRRTRAILLALSAVAWLAPRAQAQSLEPRLYSNAPLGLNFALAGYAFSTGHVVLDPSVPIKDGEINADVLLPVYVRSLGFFGMSSMIQCVAPYAWLEGRGTLTTTSASSNPPEELKGTISA